jgi:hypothetical protein
MWGWSLTSHPFSAGEQAALKQYRDRWTHIRFSTAALQPVVVEEAVREIYAAATLRSPEIRWCGGPVSIARAAAKAQSKLRPGANVKAAVVERLLDRASAKVRRVVSLAGWMAVIDEMQIRPTDSIGVTVRDAALRRARNLIVEDIGAIRGRFSFLQWIGAISRGMNFLGGSYNQHDVAWCGAYSFFRDVLGLTRETEALVGLIELSKHIGWMLPHRRVCWIGQRHDILSVNVQRRVHCATGPAVRYPDGSAFYFWKDVEIEKWLIEEPEKITLRAIDEEPDSRIRRCMIDIMTPARFIATGRPIRASWDETGILWRKSWTWGDTWAAVEVINGSPEPDGSRKHYFLQVPPNLRTAREAVAWTYGMSPAEYTSLSVRT